MAFESCHRDASNPCLTLKIKVTCQLKVRSRPKYGFILWALGPDRQAINTPIRPKYMSNERYCASRKVIPTDEAQSQGEVTRATKNEVISMSCDTCFLGRFVRRYR